MSRWSTQVTGRTLWEVRVAARADFTAFLGVEPSKIRFPEVDGDDFVECDKPDVKGQMVYDVKQPDLTSNPRRRGLVVADVTVTW